MAFSVFTVLCNHHLYWEPEYVFEQAIPNVGEDVVLCAEKTADAACRMPPPLTPTQGLWAHRLNFTIGFTWEKTISPVNTYWTSVPVLRTLLALPSQMSKVAVRSSLFAEDLLFMVTWITVQFIQKQTNDDPTRVRYKAMSGLGGGGGGPVTWSRISPLTHLLGEEFSRLSP